MTSKREEKGGEHSPPPDHGASAVEFALVLPVFLVIVLGAIDLGWALFLTAALLEAAQAGARMAAMPSSSSSEVVAEAHRILDPARLSSATITSTNVGSSGVRGGVSTVTVSVPYHSLSGTFLPEWIANSTLRQTASIRHE